MTLKSEPELRKQLADVQAAIAQTEAQLIAARNQEYALRWALGLIEEEPQTTAVAEDGEDDNRADRR